MNAMLAPPMDALEAALNDERQALLDNDADRLIASSQAKLSALRLVQSEPLRPDAEPRLRALSDLNRANGALLSRRRREVNWALRHLGRQETGTYGAGGQSVARFGSRVLGVG